LSFFLSLSQNSVVFLFLLLVKFDLIFFVQHPLLQKLLFMFLDEFFLLAVLSMSNLERFCCFAMKFAHIEGIADSFLNFSIIANFAFVFLLNLSFNLFFKHGLELRMLQRSRIQEFKFLLKLLLVAS
jgi:hypothetical protein